jgi:sulfide:quinone oxidoreductase
MPGASQLRDRLAVNPRRLPSVLVVGAGEAGLTAALRLRSAGIRVRLVADRGRASYLPGTVDVMLGEAGATRFEQRLALDGIEVIGASAEAVSGRGVRIDGGWVAADAVVAAPGLILEPGSVGPNGRVVGCWDLSTARDVPALIGAVAKGVVAVVIASLPYRCPPSPYGLAMRLAQLLRDRGAAIRVVLTTPEPHPLAALGSVPGDFLLAASARAGVEIRLGFTPDLQALRHGEVRTADGRPLAADLALVVPPHRPSPLLKELAGDGPLIPVGAGFESAEPGLFVIGDAAATPYPRAAGAATASGAAAAEAVLVRLGLAPVSALPQPQLDCYVGHGSGRYSRLRLRYPNGPPPEGRPEVEVSGPSEELGTEFASDFRRWRQRRRG